MIDSNLSWKYHIESICHKISKSIGIIAKIRHYVPRRVLLSVYNSLIVPYLTYSICGWGNCALTFQRKIVTLQKRALRLIYFSKFKEHTVPFFLKSNWKINNLLVRKIGGLKNLLNSLCVLNDSGKTLSYNLYTTKTTTATTRTSKGFTTGLHVYHTFRYISLPTLQHFDVKLTNFNVLWRS